MILPGRVRLGALTKDLLRCWEGTREVWRDGRGEEFERVYLRGLEGGVNRVLDGLEGLEGVLSRIRRDCE